MSLLHTLDSAKENVTLTDRLDRGLRFVLYRIVLFLYCDRCTCEGIPLVPNLVPFSLSWINGRNVRILGFLSYECERIKKMPYLPGLYPVRDCSAYTRGKGRIQGE